MENRNRLHARWIVAVLACLFFVLSCAGTGKAAQRADIQTVKAGIFYFDGYHMKDENESLTGYGIEVLKLVSQYSHLNFEYEGYEKSWDEMLVMLEDGSIDVVTSARKTEEWEEKFAFSLPIGENSTILSVRSDDDRYHSGDYSTYHGMKIGVIAGRSQKDCLEKFAAEKGFEYSTRVYADPQELQKALKKGSIDAILSSSLRKMHNEKVLDEIESDYFYAVVRREDTKLLDEIDYAIEQMHINEGDWTNSLYYKYYGPVYESRFSFTEREQAYIQDVLAGKKKITVTALGDRMPYSYVEDGRMTGILPDYFEKVMELAGLPYEMVVTDSRDDYYKIVQENSVDVIIDKRIPGASAEKSMYTGFDTDTYMSTGMAKVTRRDFHGEIKKIAMAEAQSSVTAEKWVTGGAEVRRYETRKEVLQAVLSGKADAAYMYTYAAQMFVNSDATNSLHYSVINEVQFDFQMSVRSSCDHELVTILNKCIQKMTEDEMNQLIAKYTSYTPGDVTFLQYMKSHPGIIAITVLLTVLAVGTIFLMWLKAGWDKKILNAEQQSKKELESQLAIVDALSRDYINVFAIDVKKAFSRVIKTKGYVDTVLGLHAGMEFPYAPAMEKYAHMRVHPQDRESLLEALSLERVMKELDSGTDYTGSYRVLENGETHNYQFVFVKVQEKSNESFVLSGFRCIDDMVRREQEQKETLAEALAEANHANHAKTIFLNNMSHDIRTPMNAIIGFTSLAASHIERRELVADYLNKIMTSSRHLLSLINDVLDMSRIESGKVRIDEKEASLPEIMHDLKTIVQSEISAKQLEFYIDTVDVANETIICDKLRLNQVLLNIISNAMKYTKPGGRVGVRIIQSSDAPEGYASYQFQVKDTGIGMSKNFLEHLFEPFEREQTSTISGIQGTGLGLAITKNIVDMMNGTIKVESEEGKGTEFTVSFQFRIASIPEETQRVEELEGLRALIVDDDINTCMSVSKMLSAIGMHPDWTTQGKEAVVRTEFAMEQKEPYDVYIIDWLMRDINGVEIVRRIRRIIGDTATIIILTAYDWADIEEEAKEAGVTAFCSKPVFLSELREILAAPCHVQAQERQEPDNAELFAGKKILLVEDNEINQEIAKAILEEAGFVLDIANDGTVAVDIMKQAADDEYDVILMDIQMSVMNGYDATRAIRAMENPVTSSIPIVAMTANAFEEDKQLALEAGMDGHVAKPIDVDKLMETLRGILGQ